MYSFQEISAEFNKRFSERHFPLAPKSLYDPAEYFLGIGGKRIRPVMCLMANELFGNINPDAYEVATAVELFHNFTLVHDDIMDKAPLLMNISIASMQPTCKGSSLTSIPPRDRFVRDNSSTWTLKSASR
jgi:hypothetical protein